MADVEFPSWKIAAAADYAERRAALVRKREKAKRTADSLLKKIADTDGEIEDLDRGAKAFGLPVDEPAPNLPRREAMRAGGDELARQAEILRENLGPSARIMNSAHPQGRQFKDVALELLAKAYPASLKAAEVHGLAETILNREFHWKTAGMTLYRLKNEFKARREGQNWFFVPEEQREAARIHHLFEGANETDDEDPPRFEKLFDDSGVATADATNGLEDLL